MALKWTQVHCLRCLLSMKTLSLPLGRHSAYRPDDTKSVFLTAQDRYSCRKDKILEQTSLSLGALATRAGLGRRPEQLRLILEG